MTDLSKEDLDHIKKKFEKADENGDGYLQSNEIKKMWEEDLGAKLTEFELESIITDLDKNSDGKISYEELVSGISKMMGL